MASEADPSASGASPTAESTGAVRGGPAEGPRRTPAWDAASRGELAAATVLAWSVLEDDEAPVETTAAAHLALGIVALAQDRLDDAAAAATRAMEMAAAAGRDDVEIVARLLTAMVASGEGDHVAAIRAVVAVEMAVASDAAKAPLRVVVDGVDAVVHLAAGDVDRAEALVDRLPPGIDRSLLEARVALERARFGAAVRRAEQILASDGASARQRIEALLIACRAHDARGEHDAAHQRREELAALTGPERHVRPYRDHGVAPPAEGSSAGTAAPWIPLSEREREILRHLRARLDNREIGEAMFISVNTVKTHLQSIYRKLGVESRREAVERATELGLL